MSCQVFLLGISHDGRYKQIQLWKTCSKDWNRNTANEVSGAALSNPLPIVIPWHRFIGADGTLTGFVEGLAIKKQMLKLEATVLLNAKLTKISRITDKET